MKIIQNQSEFTTLILAWGRHTHDIFYHLLNLGKIRLGGGQAVSAVKEEVSQKFAFRGVAARNKRKQVGLAVFPPCELSSFEKRKLHDELPYQSILGYNLYS